MIQVHCIYEKKGTVRPTPSTISRVKGSRYNEKTLHFFTVPSVLEKLTGNAIYVAVNAYWIWILACTYFVSEFAILSVVLRHTANDGVFVAGNAINSCVCLQIRVNYKKRFNNTLAVVCPFLLPIIRHHIARFAGNYVFRCTSTLRTQLTVTRGLN